MDITFFIVLIALFVFGTSFVFKARYKRTFILVFFIALCMISTLAFVSKSYRNWDARAVVFLFIAAGVAGLYTAVRKGLFR